MTRDEAIQAMAKGEKVETRYGGWIPTVWAHFDCDTYEFRRPPEPRRVARVWKNVDAIRTEGEYYEFPTSRAGEIREVLPDEVVVRKMTEAEAREWFRAYSEIHRADFRVLDAWASALMAGMDFARALGLIVEDGK